METPDILERIFLKSNRLLRTKWRGLSFWAHHHAFVQTHACVPGDDTGTWYSAAAVASEIRRSVDSVHTQTVGVHMQAAGYTGRLRPFYYCLSGYFCLGARGPNSVISLVASDDE
jgi:hypothetical protein